MLQDYGFATRMSVRFRTQARRRTGRGGPVKPVGRGFRCHVRNRTLRPGDYMSVSCIRERCDPAQVALR